MKEVEERRAVMQSELDALKSAKTRNGLGQFATPYSLARDIAACTLRMIDVRDKIRFLEPALGTGAFFSVLASETEPARIESAVGVEIDPAFAEAAEDLWLGRGIDVVTGDFTDFPIFPTLAGRFNLILTNPPYVRHHHLDGVQKQRLGLVSQSITGVKVSGLAGLYVYFLLLADACMEPDAVAAWLIPSEFMDVNYGGALKSYLTDKVELVRIHRFDPAEVQFEDALVSSAVVIFRKREPSKGHAATFTFGGSLQSPSIEAEISIETLRGRRKWSLFPSVDVSDKTAPGGSLSELRLHHLFKIKRGIATGANAVFIVPRRLAEEHGIPRKFLRPVLPSPRLLKLDVLESDPDGYPEIETQLAVINCPLSEEVVRQEYPRLYAYLDEAARDGVRDRYLVRKRKPWYRQEDRAPSPFVCTYMGRGAGEKRPFRFIWNKTEAIASNMYLMLYPIGPLERLLHRMPEAYGQVFDILNEVTGDALRGEGRVYGGGLHKIEPSELGRVPGSRFLEVFPELANAEQGTLDLHLVS